jgi:hypothetical protein
MPLARCTNKLSIHFVTSMIRRRAYEKTNREHASVAKTAATIAIQSNKENTERHTECASVQ